MNRTSNQPAHASRLPVSAPAPRPVAPPRRFSRVSGLGRPLAVFPPRMQAWQRRALTIIALISLACLLAIASWAAYLGITRYQKYGPAIVWNSLQGDILAGLVLLVIGGLAGWRAYSAGREWAVLYEGGLALDSPLGLSYCTWDKIAALQSVVSRTYLSGIFTGITRWCAITLENRDRLLITGRLDRAGALIEAVREQTFPRLYTKLARAYDEGARLLFGPLTLQRDQGLSLRGRHILWEQIESVSLENGRLSFTIKGQRARVARINADRVVNLDVLLAILDATIGVKR